MRSLRQHRRYRRLVRRSCTGRGAAVGRGGWRRPVPGDETSLEGARTCHRGPEPAGLTSAPIAIVMPGDGLPGIGSPVARVLADGTVSVEGGRTAPAIGNARTTGRLSVQIPAAETGRERYVDPAVERPTMNYVRFGTSCGHCSSSGRCPALAASTRSVSDRS